MDEILHILELENEITLITPTKNIEMYIVPKTKAYFEKLHEEEKYKFIIDLKNVTNLDSSGLAVFIKETNYVKQFHQKLAFINVNKRVYEVFQWTSILSFINICGSLEEAKSSFS